MTGYDGRVVLGIEYLLYAIYLCLGPLMWVLFGIALVKGRKRMRLLLRPGLKLPDDAPPVTILIPAKDEGERIGDCLLSALQQDYPRFDVIAIDDRSVDQTGAVMDELAAAQPQLRVLHIQPGTLPAGWTGKCNALHSATATAAGQWFLFVDSDVILQPDALRIALAYALEKRCDLVTLMPRLESHSFWEGLLVPLAGGAISVMYTVALTNNNHLKDVAFANGQFILLRRSVYEAMGGHAAVASQFCEDVAMARLLKARGYKIRISWGAELAAVRMYSSFRSIVNGWGRNFFAAAVGRPWRIWAGVLFIILCGWSAYAALAFSAWRFVHPANVLAGWGWLGTAAAHLALMTALLGLMYRWCGNRAFYALAFPLSSLLLLRIFARSLILCVTRKVTWRGTSYQHAIAPLPGDNTKVCS